MRRCPSPSAVASPGAVVAELCTALAKAVACAHAIEAWPWRLSCHHGPHHLYASEMQLNMMEKIYCSSCIYIPISIVISYII